MTNFAETTEELKGAKRVIRVGNPTLFDLKSDVQNSPKKEKMSVLIHGGSRGSSTMNDGIVNALLKIADKYPNVSFTHASGKDDFSRMSEMYKTTGLSDKENVEMLEYIYDMNDRMNRADLLVCRAGAMTISEVALLGKAAIFIPSPYVANNHQYKNAKVLYDKSAGELVEQREFPEDKLPKIIEELINNEEKRKAMGERVREFADDDANEKIYLEIKNLLKL